MLAFSGTRMCSATREIGFGQPCAQNEETNDMLLALAVILIILWLLGFFAFHVTTAFIHVVLIIALILLVLHFVRGRSAV